MCRQGVSVSHAWAKVQEEASEEEERNRRSEREEAVDAREERMQEKQAEGEHAPNSATTPSTLAMPSSMCQCMRMRMSAKWSVTQLA